MIKLILTLCLFVAGALAKRARLEKMLQEAKDVDSYSARQHDLQTAPFDSKLNSSDVSNSSRQSGSTYPTSCYNVFLPSSKVLKVVKDAFQIYGAINERRDYIVDNVSYGNVIIVSATYSARGASDMMCVNYKGYDIWLTEN